MGIRSFAAELFPQSLRASATAATEPGDTPSTFAGLQDRLAYLSKTDLKAVRLAYRFADEAHLGQFRASGEPYITHPIAVAALCAEWRLDAQGIMAALMHDAMEDCGITKAELIDKFGSVTAELVDGLTKLDKLQFNTREESQAESFRKMLLAMARDVRVVLIKLADRLHNMRTMGAMAPAKRHRIATETLDIYAPIAHRLGLNQTYRELQDLCFQMLHPWRFAVLAKALHRAKGNRRDIVDRVRREVVEAFNEAHIKLGITGREKTVYSAYQKMQEKRLGFTQVSDLFGFRITVHSLSECYLALGVLHQLFKPLPGKFKDYIAIPKANGYQSLHTTLVSPLGTAVEFQIRTESMHAVAEKGVAAHWMYKIKDGSAVKGVKGDKSGMVGGAAWLQSLVDIQDETRDAAEFLEHVKIDLFPEEVYVFTPKSRILALPRGATPVDFAYAIHSDVGDKCVAAIVNGESTSLRNELRSGDVVEIVTAPGARPNPAWLNFVVTGRARSKIRNFLKSMEEEESVALGERMLAQALRTEGLELPSWQEGDQGAEEVWQALIKWTGAKQRAELLKDIGLGRQIAVIVAKRLAQLMAERQALRPDAVTLTLGHFLHDEHTHRQGVVFIDGSQDSTVRLASCCRPIPGDGILGYLGKGEGLTVHTTECKVAKKLLERDRERWMTVEWSEEPVRSFESVLHVLVANLKGALAQVATAISNTEADITHIDMEDEKGTKLVDLRLTVGVRDRVHLAQVMKSLRRASVVKRVNREKA